MQFYNSRLCCGCQPHRNGVCVEFLFGAPSRNCTDDLHLTMVLLYSLSYRGVKIRAPLIRGCPYIKSIQQELKIANG